MEQQPLPPEQLPQKKSHHRARINFMYGILLTFGVLVLFFALRVFQYTEDFRHGIIDTEGFTQHNTSAQPATTLTRAEIETTDDPSFGNPNAKVVVVEFGDFECPFCRQAFPIIRKLEHEFQDDVLFIWRDLPLTSIHPHAQKAAEAGECAHEQNKFWEYHDKLFINQHALTPQDLKRYAAELGLDTRRFNLCLDSNAYAAEVEDDFQTALRAGARGTPTFFINGEMISGVLSEDIFRSVLKELLQSPTAK